MLLSEIKLDERETLIYLISTPFILKSLNRKLLYRIRNIFQKRQNIFSLYIITQRAHRTQRRNDKLFEA